MNNKEKISFQLSQSIWQQYPALLKQTILDHHLKRICDVGGGANPVIPPDFIHDHGLDYSLLDISKEELDKAPNQYKKIIADIANPNGLEAEDGYDLVFTKMLAEHVKDGEWLHRNVYSILRPGGYAIHFMPTMYSLPFVINFLLPESFATKILDWVSPRDRYKKAKFPAYYSWCIGPTKSHMERLEQLGYHIESMQGGFGHEYYSKIPIVHQIHSAITRLLMKKPVPHLTSYCLIILRKPEVMSSQSSNPKSLDQAA